MDLPPPQTGLVEKKNLEHSFKIGPPQHHSFFVRVQPCHVVYTDYRPVPLQHYIFPAGGDGIHLVVDEKGQFREDNFNAAMAVLYNAGDAAQGDQRGRKGGVKVLSTSPPVR